ncbi:MAG: SUMF1/EgtB/PvdO family nonheme iron enzyme [Planctomycetes bacterium]|nr:SUMF1/EgtB/PvdO family nonheme iron enzyme [Planctomycetota bacterium]
MTDHAEDIQSRLRRDHDRGELRDLDFYLDLADEGDLQTIAALHQSIVAAAAVTQGPSGADSVTLGVAGLAGPGRAAEFGPYRLLGELGRGGQGMVYLAEDTRLGRKVALKLLAGFGATSKQGILRFRREAEAASRLDDPGICTVYETGEFDGVPFIAMQYVDGETLAARIRAGQQREASARTESGADSGSSAQRRDLDDWVLVIERVARSLHAAHEVGLVHRDVKPANVMLGRDDRPVILDFGLARTEDLDSQGLTQTGDLIGTPAYMAPEQIRGKVHEVDRRTDVYALGVSLFECLVGHRPFNAATREALYHRIVEGRPPAPSRFQSQIPRDLDVIVLTALERDPDRRYQSAGALADDLRRFRHREPIAARPAGPLLRLGRWAERNPALAVALALLFLFLSVGLVVTTSLWRKSEQALDEAREATDRADAKSLEAQANLRDYEMLSDLQRVDDYVDEIEMLFPASPDRLPLIAEWKRRVAELQARKPEFERRLAILRQRSRELDLAEIIRRRSSHEVDEVVDLDRRLARLATGDTEGPADVAAGDELKTALEARRSKLVDQLLASNRHRFAGVAEAWKHLNLERLIRSIDALEVGEPAPLDEVLFLEEQCRIIAARSLEGPAAAAWSEARARIAAPGSPYHGLRLEPQLGLLPLGPDPISGLEEFAQVLTGRPTRRAADGRLELVPDFALIFVLLPGGDFEFSFDTGDLPQKEPGPRRLRLDPFFIAKHEMTLAQWEHGTNDLLRNPVGLDGISQEEYDRAGRSPLKYVAWEVAERYLHRLGFEFPTEAQWEYAARAGEKGRWPGGDEAQLGLHANFAQDSDLGALNDPFAGLALVGQLEANGFGLHDLLGNVWELTRDGLDVDGLPLMPGDGLHSLGGLDAYIIRGGGYRNPPAQVRYDIRASIDRSSSSGSVGLRPVRPLRSGTGR